MREEDQSRFPPVLHVLKNGHRVTIRPLALKDGPALADFYQSVPAADVRFYCPHLLTREKAMENAAAALSPLQVVLVVEAADSRIAGYAWYRWESEHSSTSSFGICIRHSFQGLGAGRALMCRLLEIARVIGPPVMGLTVQKANPKAFALYRSMGFLAVREQLRATDNEPEYYMQLKVR